MSQCTTHSSSTLNDGNPDFISSGRPGNHFDLEHGAAQHGHGWARTEDFATRQRDSTSLPERDGDRRRSRKRDEGIENEHKQRHPDRPHHQSDKPPANDPRAATEEPPLETGQPYLSPRSPVVAPEKFDSLFKPLYPNLSVFSLLIFATIWGVLARLGLIWIGGFAEREVFALVWAQMVGCAVMGVATERKKGIERVFPPLFVLCGTGFCGSLTTWSSMSHDVFVSFANLGEPSGTSRFSGFLSGAAVTLITLVACMSSLQFGVHLSSFLPRFQLPHRRLPSQKSFNALILLSGPLFWLGSIFLLIFGPHSWRSRATFAIVLGPPGTLLRYYLSKKLNPIHPSLPYGTLLMNSLSVLIFAVMELLARHPRGQLGCAALKGVQDGFCGSLSTISTMAVELRGLKRGQSYRYFGVSWALAQLIFLVVVGSWVWTGDRGAVSPALPITICERFAIPSLGMHGVAISAQEAFLDLRFLPFALPLQTRLVRPLYNRPIMRSTLLLLTTFPLVALSSSPAETALPANSRLLFSRRVSPALPLQARQDSAAAPSPSSMAVAPSPPPATGSGAASEGATMGPDVGAMATAATADGDGSMVNGTSGEATAPAPPPPPSSPPPADDPNLIVLQLAFVLENLESTLYKQALAAFSVEVMIKAGLTRVQAIIIIEQITVVQADETKHMQALESAIAALGGTPVSSCSFDFSAVLKDPITFLGAARTIEAAGQAAYLGAAHLLTDPQLLTTAGSILTLEARHQSLLNLFNGGAFTSQSFDIALSPSGVLALAGGFMKGCQASDFGLTSNNPLTITTGGGTQFAIGSKLDFKSIILMDMAALSCQMIIGGSPAAMVFPAEKCVVPAGIDGPVAVYITNSTTPLASNILIQNVVEVQAGPGLIFVDSVQTTLSSLFVIQGGGGGQKGGKGKGGKKGARGKGKSVQVQAKTQVNVKGGKERIMC
ncbi:hypothetical protein JCM11641_006017 [Rhodosporidiobolus odoratus]